MNECFELMPDPNALRDVFDSNGGTIVLSYASRLYLEENPQFSKDLTDAEESTNDEEVNPNL